jgi:hypothetical protein
MSKTTSRNTMTLAAIIAIALLASTVAQAGPSGRCARVELPAQVVLPDGTRHEAATLRICETRKLSPVATLHKTYLDGMPVGMFTSRTGISEGREHSEPFMVFERNSEGHLALVGLGWPEGDATRTFTMTESNKRRKNRSDQQQQLAANEEASQPIVLLAAITD